MQRVKATGWLALWMGDWNSRVTTDVMMPLQEAGSWQLLNMENSRMDPLFGSGLG